MSFRPLAAVAVLQLAAGAAHACLFATSMPPEGWYKWSSALYAGDVAGLEKDAAKPVDVISVRVVETFKGPDATNGTLTVRVPARHWAACRLEPPAVGARVLVAVNPNSDAMLVPLAVGYAGQLRAYKLK